VPVDKCTRAAISLTDAPVRATFRTSRSRSVNGLVPALNASAANVGSTALPPECTVRMASANCSAGASLTIKPRAPAAIVRCKYLLGCGNPVYLGHLDIQNRNVYGVLSDSLNHTCTVRQLLDDLQIRF